MAVKLDAIRDILSMRLLESFPFDTHPDLWNECGPYHGTFIESSYTLFDELATVIPVQIAEVFTL
jgi:hypothetical protein